MFVHRPSAALRAAVPLTRHRGQPSPFIVAPSLRRHSDSSDRRGEKTKRLTRPNPAIIATVALQAARLTGLLFGGRTMQGGQVDQRPPKISIGRLQGDSTGVTGAQFCGDSAGQTHFARPLVVRVGLKGGGPDRQVVVRVRYLGR
jgi:hypothetical protein